MGSQIGSEIDSKIVLHPHKKINSRRLYKKINVDQAFLSKKKLMKGAFSWKR